MKWRTCWTVVVCCTGYRHFTRRFLGQPRNLGLARPKAKAPVQPCEPLLSPSPLSLPGSTCPEALCGMALSVVLVDGDPVLHHELAMNGVSLLTTTTELPNVPYREHCYFQGISMISIPGLDVDF